MEREHTSVLLQRAREGSREALDTLIELVGERLLAYIRLRMPRNLRANIESRDVLQVTLLRAFQRFDQFQGSGSDTLMGWMAAIAKHEILGAVEFHARQKRDWAKEVPLDDLGTAAAVVAEVRSEVSRIAMRRDLELLEAALERLEPSHREVILLRKFEELGFAEIGERMDRSPDACRMLLTRAMAALSEGLQRQRAQP